MKLTFKDYTECAAEAMSNVLKRYCRAVMQDAGLYSFLGFYTLVITFFPDWAYVALIWAITVRSWMIFYSADYMGNDDETSTTSTESKDHA